MKAKKIYLYFAVLIIIVLIFISILIARQNTQNLPLPQAVEPQEEAITEQGALTPGYMEQLPYAAENRPAITKIKKPLARETGSTIKKQEVGSSSRKSRPLASTGQNTAGSGETPGELTDYDTPSGITKIDKKRPSPKEAEEMNARGIIMY